MCWFFSLLLLIFQIQYMNRKKMKLAKKKNFFLWFCVEKILKYKMSNQTTIWAPILFFTQKKIDNQKVSLCVCFPVPSVIYEKKETEKKITCSKWNNFFCFVLFYFFSHCWWLAVVVVWYLKFIFITTLLFNIIIISCRYFYWKFWNFLTHTHFLAQTKSEKKVLHTQ